jgi:hypothetical protein
MNIKLYAVIFAIVLSIKVQASIHILSIGISDYPTNSGWNKLSADNDIQLIKKTFPNSDIKVISNDKATKANILSALNNLITVVNAGDTVIVHVSCHGQQIITETSSAEPDKLDEAIVPYDAMKTENNYYHGQNHLTDNEFGGAIRSIRRALGTGSLVIVLLDACHSGSMDKADTSTETYRGTDEIFGANQLSSEQQDSLRRFSTRRDNEQLESGDSLSDAVFISACLSNQRNYEISRDDRSFGSLTYYFCSVYGEKSMCDLDSFLSSLYEEMSSDKILRFHGQTPEIRNTVGWIAPNSNHPIATIKQPSQRDDNDNGNSIYGYLIAGLILGIIIILIWKKKH